MYQKTQLIGRLGADPEMRFTQKGTPVTTFRVAVDGRQNETTWFRVTTWGKLAEVCNQYLGKGRLVFVEGEVKVSTWTGKDGQPRATLELTANTVKFLERGRSTSDVPDVDEAAMSEPEPTSESAPDTHDAYAEPEPVPSPKPSPASVTVPEEPDFDFDDLPF